MSFGDHSPSNRRVILHELHAQFGNGRCFACSSLGRAGITTPANLRQPFMDQRADLFNG